MKNFAALVIALLLLAYNANAQRDEDTAYARAEEAVKLMDAGKLDECIVLLKEAQKLDPTRSLYPFETAYAYVLKQDYGAAVKELEGSLNYADVVGRHYQLLGNAYDRMGNLDAALKVYNSGLEKFPRDGGLYLEKGNVYWRKNKQDSAAALYEAGIQVEPAYPGNYYRAALLYCRSKTKFLGMVYGEIFMNLERNSSRTGEISKLLYDTYTSGITIKDKVAVDFGKITVGLNNGTGKFRVTYSPVGCYQLTLLPALADVKELTPVTLSLVRERFIKLYYKKGYEKDCPHILFAYQRNIDDAGHTEAYSRWVMQMADEADFQRWCEANPDKWGKFRDWFIRNPLTLSEASQTYIPLQVE